MTNANHLPTKYPCSRVKDPLKAKNRSCTGTAVHLPNTPTLPAKVGKASRESLNYAQPIYPVCSG